MVHKNLRNPVIEYIYGKKSCRKRKFVRFSHKSVVCVAYWLKFTQIKSFRSLWNVTFVLSSGCFGVVLAKENRTSNLCG